MEFGASEMSFDNGPMLWAAEKSHSFWACETFSPCAAPGVRWGHEIVLHGQPRALKRTIFLSRFVSARCRLRRIVRSWLFCFPSSQEDVEKRGAGRKINWFYFITDLPLYTVWLLGRGFGG